MSRHHKKMTHNIVGFAAMFLLIGIMFYVMWCVMNDSSYKVPENMIQEEKQTNNSGYKYKCGWTFSKGWHCGFHYWFD